MKSKLTAYNVFLTLILMLNLFSILPPFLMEIGLEEVAKPIYLVYSFFCHQIHYRSLHVFDYQFAWCTRDTFIWLGLLVSAISLKYFRIKDIKLYQVTLFVFPIALDGGVQLIATFLGLTSESLDAFYVSTNFTRMLTGGFLGIGLGLWIFPVLESVETQAKKTKKEISLWKLAGINFAVLFTIYFIFVGIWGVTSTEYVPENMLDHANRFPEDKSEWFLRRKNAVCPVNAEEESFYSFGCEEKED